VSSMHLQGDAMLTTTLHGGPWRSGLLALADAEWSAWVTRSSRRSWSFDASQVRRVLLFLRPAYSVMLGYAIGSWRRRRGPQGVGEPALMRGSVAAFAFFPSGAVPVCVCASIR
jgi:hypothetical protein